MNIQDIVKTPGWREVKAIFAEMVREELKNIPLNQSADQIAIQYIANRKAKDIVNRALSKIEKITDETEVKKVSYK